MSSVSIKLLVIILSLFHDESWKTQLWVWLSFVVDFIGIFFVVSFAFYNPSDERIQAHFDDIADIYFYLFLLGIVPFAVPGSVGIHLYWTINSTHECTEDRLLYFCGITGCGLLMFLLQMAGLCGTLLMMQIFGLSLVMMQIFGLSFGQRLPYTSTDKPLYLEYSQWAVDGAKDLVDGNGSILVPKSKDRVIRVCVLNQQLYSLGLQYQYNDASLIMQVSPPCIRIPIYECDLQRVGRKLYGQSIEQRVLFQNFLFFQSIFGGILDGSAESEHQKNQKWDLQEL